MCCFFLYCELSRSAVAVHGTDFLLSRGLLSLALPWDTTEVVSTWVKRWICFSHPGWVERDVPQGAWDLVLSLENIPSIYKGISRAKLIFLLHFTKAQAEPSPGKPNRACIPGSRMQTLTLWLCKHRRICLYICLFLNTFWCTMIPNWGLSHLTRRTKSRANTWITLLW